MTTIVTALSSLPISPLITTAKSAEPTTEAINIKTFNSKEQATLFKSLKYNQFSGMVIFRDCLGLKTIFHLFHGRLVFATGGHHPLRRWSRNLKLYCPSLVSDSEAIAKDELPLTHTAETINWQYQVLSEGMKEEKISRKQVFHVIRGLFAEIFFDLTQAKQITYILQPSKSSCTPLILINPEDIITEVGKLWLGWEKSRLSKYSPNLAPVISHPKQLEAQSPPTIYKLLLQYLDGQTSLRDLAVHLQQDDLSLMRVLLIYIQWGLIKLVAIEDISGTVEPVSLTSCLSPSLKENLVVYIDDNLERGQRMKNLIVSGGYHCVIVHKSSEAVAMCLAQNPDIILVNTQISDNSAYNIGHQLRKLPFFRDTPILVLAERVSLKERLMAKFTKISLILSQVTPSDLITATLFKSLSQESTP
ncbi:response regulator receiver protein [Gloeothece citriformis PCC 7424]|uniref:Response regulator receiver protein n=1 Tax=Gloeothece citriformis (strain PCC 7424) TaxID=65393 RepID=B7KIN6_GLOC7|nr:response regulator [Gloeothece citriformis]ACK69442.1 response regulator receiver protein [Gloeothece citriformis PCC 7424]